MTPFNLRSLLLAAIFLSNCISWTTSKHHHTHNVNGHRSRHRRQGAGLFLSASHVLPGGEGSGWGEWGEVSPCSRTCGGGVASQKRICLQVGPDGQTQCSGGDTKYFSCQTQDCPAGSKDFRAEQCSEFDDQLFRDIKYKWVPYTKAPNPCELNCMPHAERFYYRHKAKVIDGTRCSDESFDVCVNGTCQPVGCDMMLGSNAKEDNCRECRGNNANCRTTSGIYDAVDLRKGYNDVLLIPEGATTIVLAEVAPSNNYLALRAKNGTFYLNGDYHIDFPRTLYIAGVLWTYERSQQGFAAPDKLRCQGPTNEPLFVSLLLQDENVGIEYQYSLPNEMAPRQDKRYNWVHEEYTPCSASCGGGFQTRNVSCRSREELEVVDEGLCDKDLRPPTNQSCNTQACDPQWVPGAWSQCSKRCGKGGTRSREITCQKIISNGYPSIVEDKECFDQLGPKQELFQTCNENATCPTWFTGPWRACDMLCGEGKQKRQVVCYQQNGRRKAVLGDSECQEEKPAVEQTCMLEPCDGVDWVVSPWIGCDTCLSEYRTRTAVCSTKDHVVIDDKYCAYHPEVTTKERCDPKKIPACEVQWYASKWSKCSVQCGKGEQTRKVFCGLFDGKSVEVVDEKLCAGQPKYNESKPCEIPKEDCPWQWYSGPWSACSKTCDGGDKIRRVWCLRGEEMDNDKCGQDNAPAAFQRCNTAPCGELATSGTTPTLDYEDCTGDELYREIGLDDGDLGITPDDAMFSDSPAGGSAMTTFAELESSFMSTDSDFSPSSDGFMIVEGSGTGSTETIFTDDLTTETGSGSGFGSTSEIDTTVTGASSSSEDTATMTSIYLSSLSSESSSDSSTTEGSSTVTEDTNSTVTTDISAVSTTTELPKHKSTPRVTLSLLEEDEVTPTTEIPTGTGSSETTERESSETTEKESTESTETGSTETTETGSVTTTEAGSTLTTETGSTETSETTESGSTETSETTESGSTETTETGSTETSQTAEISSTLTIDTTESGPTETSETTESGSTETSETTESGSTETTETVSTETSQTSEIGSTQTSDTTDSGPTETTETTESGSTETTETGSTETSETAEISSTQTSHTTESGSTETSDTSESGSTETSETTESGSTETNETGSTETSETTESGSTETSETTETGSTETSETTESGSTETSETTESGSTETNETGSTETSETTESGSTETSETTEPGSTETNETGSTETSETTESGSTKTNETGSTETSETTESESTETSETGSTETSETTESGFTEFTETTESTSELSSETDSDWSTDAEGLTSSAVDWITPKNKMCKPRCHSVFGCCPDGKTPAKGPFDNGCPERISVCTDTKYGCCPDEVSAALGDNFKGCPEPDCNETLFGCCLSDNKTAAEGNDQEGCPPPPPACKSSKFGCCKDEETEATGPAKEGCPETTVPETEPPSTTTPVYEGCEVSEFGCCFDNATEATGPDQQGCPCDTTEFGCCLDGVSPAEGPAYEGCLKNCNSSAYGCCPDEESPAHGPNKEGCCLRSTFGCCQDNYNYARGPDYKGCGCQNSPYGCCPDNTTSASGRNDEGCGCSYSPYGCCPDGHTESTGPEFEGCECHTYQFGCCPDGVTVARGPDGHGCHCLQSKYKCCGDGETHATGPNKEGCDCSSSKYGCCPDGQTEATGTKFQGCTDAPEDKQAACSLKFDSGPCRNDSVYWYFDTEYGGCSQFWYGGCEGNGNRFATKEDCDDTCVSPPPKNACNLPSSKGACLDHNVRWYYDSERETCTNFVYGGCLGNNNNFETRELCEKQCEPKKSTEQCSLLIDRGSCAGNFPRWGFNQETKNCEEFTWGGCEGNPNRFSTEAACNLRCNPPGQPKPECTQPQKAGNCSEIEAVWSYSQSEKRCMPFYYTGCGGNENRFTSKVACEGSCPSPYVPDKCTLPYETGNCANYREKWYFDTKDQRCRQFYYGGCGGNANNYVSEAECQRECQPLPSTITIAQPTTQTSAPRQARPQYDREDFCYLAMDAGPCTNMTTVWAYDYKTGRCITFQYGGCGGNRNNFPDEQYCTSYCKTTQDICQLPMQSGPCDDSQMKWFYDAATDSCSQFTYGGCEGNDNRFDSRDECEHRCKTGPVAQQTTAVATTTVEPRRDEIPPGCTVSPTLEACTNEQAGEVWYLDPQTRECIAHENLADGAGCRTTGVFRSQEGCERSCGAFRGIANVCVYPLDAGSCTSYGSKYFFNSSSSRCEEFMYSGCLGGPNRFSSQAECADICNPTVDPCKQPPEPGNCLARYVMWYYDEERNQCGQYVYGGCGGNDNRFESREECEGRCKKEEIATTTTTQAPVQQAVPECTTPDSLDVCGANETVFYYDASTSTCRASGFGGCRHPNSYDTEEECERQCGAFRGLDICRAQLDPGPCRAAFTKYYFDAATGSCKEFTYGGCQGGPNRFSTIDECENNCKESGPASACLQEVSVGESCETPPTRRWYYDRTRGDCLVFAYQGCGGTDNKFVSYQECTDLCHVYRPDTEARPTLCDSYSEECEALERRETCTHGIKVTVASEGCERCACEEPPSCEREEQECQQIRCQYGVERTAEANGCERCKCSEDPCARANCSADERCEASAYKDPATQSVQYTANCVKESDNEVLPADCEQFEEHCAQLSCTYGVQRTTTSRGCMRCSCVQEEVNCTILHEECDKLKCNYGMNRLRGADGCFRCQCESHPCANKQCPDRQRCVLTPSRDAVTRENRYLADCRDIEKPGHCPVDNSPTTEGARRWECHDDADCRGIGKCCARGSSHLCLVPQDPTQAPTTTLGPFTQHITTYRPDAPRAPQASTETEPEVAVSEGGIATLKCIFHGNPPPKISWQFGQIMIDGDHDRYRLLSNGALEIVSLFRNDSGVYVCIAQNNLGTARQEIRLQVNDPVEGAAYIAGEANAVIIGELDRPLEVRCRAYGYPTPSMYWYRGLNGPMVPYSNALYEARGQVLTIRRLTYDTLGEYACLAYNGHGKAATWVVTVQAYQPDDNAIGSRYLVPSDRVVAVTPRERTTDSTTATTTTPAPAPAVTTPLYIVEVQTQLLPASTTISAGSELSLPCNVDGYPEPRVTWSKDGVQLSPTETMWITETRLTIPRATSSDSGVYGCHASNQYSTHSSTVQINVQDIVIPSKCTDSTYFANCALIVQSRFCNHKYYSRFCCKSCVEAGQLDPSDVSMQSDEPYRKK